MTFDPENIPIVCNDWFSPRVEYKGQGRAQFLDPAASIEGSAHVQIKENGALTIEMEIERIVSDTSFPLGPLQLFSPQKPINLSGAMMITFGGAPPNPCTRLTVATLQGEFSAAESISYSYSLDITGGRNGTITFTSLHAQFDVTGRNQPHYWVMPLSNFLSTFVTSHPLLDRHPLRIYPTPIVPDGLTETDAFIATHNANIKNHLITFEFMGTPGFIEALPDYDARKKNLTEGCGRHSITSVMVGDVGSNSMEQPHSKAWFPDDFLRLLSLVTGAPVGCPWIEFRDDQGKLVRRIHIRLNQSPFSRGHCPVSEDLHSGIHSGIGYLLTRYQSSPDRGESYLKVVLKHMFHAARYDQSVEDTFIYLIRALDNLCQHYGFKGRDSLMSSLDNKWQEIVRSILSNAAKQIRDEARKAALKGQLDQSRALNGIAERTIQTPGGKANSFGLAVVELLKHFSLPDADIVDTHYSVSPRPDGITSWSDVLSKYRGAPIHGGSFNILKNGHDLDDISIIETHLRDLLLRIVFKIICYDGTYQPPLKMVTSITPTDWVVPGLPARELGYK